VNVRWMRGSRPSSAKVEDPDSTQSGRVCPKRKRTPLETDSGADISAAPAAGPIGPCGVRVQHRMVGEASANLASPNAMTDSANREAP